MQTPLARRFLMVLAAACLATASSAVAQPAPPFSPARLVKNGDNAGYGSYRIIGIGDGVYQVKDPGNRRPGPAG